MRYLVISFVCLAACQRTISARTPTVTAVEPVRICNVDAAVITVRGTNFDPMVPSMLTDRPSPQLPSVLASGPGLVELTDEAWTDNQTMTAVVPAQTPAGVYDVTVVNPMGPSGTGARLLEVLAPSSSANATGVDPQFGYRSEETPISIDGSAFAVGSQVYLVAPSGALHKLKRVAYVDANTMTAVVPQGLAEGSYGLRVVDTQNNPCPSTLPNAFRVSATPIPRVVFVTDDFFTSSQAPVTTVACGQHLDPMSVMAELLPQPTGTAIPLTVAAGPTGVCPISMQSLSLSHATTLGTGQYQVRLKASADTSLFSDYFVIVVVAPSANLNAFAASTPMTTPRRGAAVVVARNDLGQRFVYAIGGDNPANTAQGTADSAAASVHNTVELAAANYDPATQAFQLAAFKPNTTTLPETRFAPVAVAVEAPDRRYIYVFGGNSSGTTAVGSVARALVLPETGTPTLVDDLAATAPGNVPAGAYTYVVSAVQPASDPSNPGGETLPSDEASIVLTASSQVTVNFIGVLGAEKYRIYRTPAAPDPDAGISQRERLVAEVADATACMGGACRFVDDTAAVGTARPLVHGSLGTWKTVSVTTAGGTMALWGQQAHFYRTTANPGHIGYIYLTGGTADGNSGSTQIMRFAVKNDLSLEAGDNTDALPLATYFHSGAQLNGVGNPVKDRLYALFGRGGSRYDHAEIDPATGALGTFVTETMGLPTLAGASSVALGRKAFVFGGDDNGTITATSLDGVTVNSGSFQNFNNASRDMTAPRFLSGAVRVGPFVFVVGGYNTTAGTLASVDRASFL